MLIYCQRFLQSLQVVQHGITSGKNPTGVSRIKSERERKIGHRRVGVGGEITYKKVSKKCTSIAYF